ncbi:MAG TPA: HAD family hydrolase, partial [Acidimicrobiales bacterium]|nr:HAD family hydrolase [Acidimicrobiales bacterium]
SSPEWSAYLRDELGLHVDADRISALVVDHLLQGYRRALPLLPGAGQAVERLGGTWPLGLASSSNREVIDEVLHVSGLGRRFAVTVSSEEVARGKPAPDVYLETARRLGVPAGTCVAVEDSGNGIRSAVAAGMAVVAVPNPHFAPPAAVLAEAAAVVSHLDELTVALVAGLVDGAA